MSESNPLFVFMTSLKHLINRVVLDLTLLFCWGIFFFLGFRSGINTSNIMSNAGYSDVLWSGVTLFATFGAIIVLGPKIFPRGIHQIWSEKPVTLIAKIRYLPGIIGIGSVSGGAVHAFLVLANAVLVK